MLMIFKYPIPIEDHFTLELPKDAKVLAVQVQREMPQLWAAVDPEAERETRHFRLSGTGHPIDGGDFLKDVELYRNISNRERNVGIPFV